MMATVEKIQGYSAWVLARMAGCASPDTDTSAGARFLESVRDDILGRIEDNAETMHGMTADRRVDWMADAISETADGAPDIYTAQRWAEFVDLAAWTEDITELGGTADDLTAAAGIALYMIAERLARAIVEDWTEDDDESDDDTGEA